MGEGVDPLEEKRAAGRGRTFGDLMDDFMEKYVQVNRFKTEKAIRRRLDRNIPAAWKRRNADAIETWEIEALHKKIGANHLYEANRLLEILRTMYGQAPLWKYLAKDAPNPTKGIKRFKEKKRKRWVTPEEVPPLVQAIDEEANVYVRVGVGGEARRRPRADLRRSDGRLHGEVRPGEPVQDRKGHPPPS